MYDTVVLCTNCKSWNTIYFWFFSIYFVKKTSYLKHCLFSHNVMMNE